MSGVVECTGIAAYWCAIHGECTCLRSREEEDVGIDLDADDCPLHKPTSAHARHVLRRAAGIAVESRASVHRVVLDLCDLCLGGAGGECHTPGCALWMNRAPDMPVNDYKVLARMGSEQTGVSVDTGVRTPAGTAVEAYEASLLGEDTDGTDDDR